jgi:aminoglycoside phosphotransferase (APT) family kinase protein
LFLSEKLQKKLIEKFKKIMSSSSLDFKALEQRLETLTGTVYEIREAKLSSEGHSNKTWLIDAEPAAFVVKVRAEPNVVYASSPALEPKIMRLLNEFEAPVPRIIATDNDESLLGAPWFAMEYIQSQAIPDDMMTAYLKDGWFCESTDEIRGGIWCSFINSLASIHNLPIKKLGAALRGGNHSKVIEYLCESLENVANGKMPRTASALQKLRRCAPENADDDVALCMGDSRLGNALVRNDSVVALVDWEIAYWGNPRTDIAYAIAHDRYICETNGADQLGGLMTADESWSYWESLTNRVVTRRDRQYWEAFAMAILAVTADRVIGQLITMGQMDVDFDSAEKMNPFLTWCESRINEIN